MSYSRLCFSFVFTIDSQSNARCLWFLWYMVHCTYTEICALFVKKSVGKICFVFHFLRQRNASNMFDACNCHCDGIPKNMLLCSKETRQKLTDNYSVDMTSEYWTYMLSGLICVLC